MNGRRVWWIRGAALLFVLALVAIVILADLGWGRTLFAFVHDVPGGDLAGHFLLMGCLSFLVNLSLDAARLRLGGLRPLLGSVIVGLLVTLEEFTQLYLPSRSFSPVDLLFDYAGIFAFGWLAARLARRL